MQRAIPVGDTYIEPTNKNFQYRWVDDDSFQIFLDNNWMDAIPIDFDFD
jgi:hypothetical protein